MSPMQPHQVIPDPHSPQPAFSDLMKRSFVACNDSLTPVNGFPLAGLTGSWETNKMACMKTTLDLPDDLVRAVQDGRKLKDAVADLLRKGLAASTAPRRTGAAKASSRIKTDPTTGLPVIIGDPNAPARKMTVAQLLALEQETQTQEDLERLGLSS
jgi:hypothetical protein